KDKGTPLQEKEVESTVKFGGGRIMVWGCMGWNGYVTILEEFMVESIKKLETPEENVIFQQDNDPKHTSKLA
ncbi:hypothetical protein M422DRAFT_195669, partial [Sphaerobolus stellatus SS14]